MADHEAKLPTVFLLGAAKSGTSALYDLITQHPDVYRSLIKEPSFFLRNHRYEKGVNWYLNKYFKDSSGYKVVIDATPTYLSHPEIIAPRIKEVYSDSLPLFIALLRDPAKRAWSHYLHRVRSQGEGKSFADALDLEETRLANNPTDWVGYKRDGMYHTLLSRWFNYFPRERFLILLSDDLKNDLHGTLNRIFDFFGLKYVLTEEFPVTENRAAYSKYPKLTKALGSTFWLKRTLTKLIPENYRWYLKRKLIHSTYEKYASPPKISEDDARRLHQELHQEIENLEVLIARDLSQWKEQS